MAQQHTQVGTSAAAQSRTRLQEPHNYKVIFHNDDVTTMDFVVMVLTTVFKKDKGEATALMLQVHHQGSAVVGIYSYDMATTRRQRAVAMARDAGFPLNITLEQAD